MWFLEMLLWILAAVAVFVLSGFFWHWYYRLPHEPDETHHARTTDGWRVALHRYRPAGNSPREMPVILCHGLLSNRYDLDFDPEASLAQYLAREGYDCWVLELRGAGFSSRPGRGRSYRYGWCFDDYWRSDLPAAIDYVRAATQSRSVYWIGHSMGGMLVYPYLALMDGADAPAICAAVTIASPVNFALMHPAIRSLVRMKPFTKAFPVFFFPLVAKAFTPFFGLLDRYVRLFGLNTDSLSRDRVRRIVNNMLENGTSREVLLQFHDWLVSGCFRSKDLQIDFIDRLPSIRTPLLVIAGNRDQLAPPESVRTAADRVSSEPKAFRLFGKESGDGADYNHVDLVTGPTAPSEVYPVIREWLERNAPSGSGEASSG